MLKCTYTDAVVIELFLKHRPILQNLLLVSTPFANAYI